MAFARSRYLAVALFVGPTTTTTLGPAAAAGLASANDPEMAAVVAAATRTMALRAERPSMWPPVSRTPHVRGDDWLSPGECRPPSFPTTPRDDRGRIGPNLPVRWSGGGPSHSGA